MIIIPGPAAQVQWKLVVASAWRADYFRFQCCVITRPEVGNTSFSMTRIQHAEGADVEVMVEASGMRSGWAIERELSLTLVGWLTLLSMPPNTVPPSLSKSFKAPIMRPLATATCNGNVYESIVSAWVDL